MVSKYQNITKCTSKVLTFSVPHDNEKFVTNNCVNFDHMTHVDSMKLEHS